MYKKPVAVVLMSLLLANCATVPTEGTEMSEMVKAYLPPTPGNAALYIYRGSGLGTALKKDVWVDGECVGETAPNTFFYVEVKGDMEHEISTESEFSPNDIRIRTISGETYFVRQYIKMGVFVGGAGLEQVDEEKGKAAVAKLKLATAGTCSKQQPVAGEEVR